MGWSGYWRRSTASALVPPTVRLGGVLGISPRSVGRALGARCPEASWIVAKKTEQPTGYAPREKQRDLEQTPPNSIGLLPARGHGCRKEGRTARPPRVLTDERG